MSTLNLVTGFSPVEKNMLVKLDHFPKVRLKITNIWNHRPGNVPFLNHGFRSSCVSMVPLPSWSKVLKAFGFRQRTCPQATPIPVPRFPEGNRRPYCWWAEIQRSPVEVGSLSHYLGLDFILVVWDFWTIKSIQRFFFYHHRVPLLNH